ncbi:hypothetical protein BZG36_02529, partial [Bifiguratus adelaidae]
MTSKVLPVALLKAYVERNAMAKFFGVRSLHNPSFANLDYQDGVIEGDKRIEGEWDEATREVIALLSNMQDGFSCVLEKVKLDIGFVKDTAAFLKKRAKLEEEYAKSMLKLAQSTMESCERYKDRTGTAQLSHLNSWQDIISAHDQIAQEKLEFAKDTHEIADGLLWLARETERGRKQYKEMGIRNEKTLAEFKIAEEKARSRYEASQGGSSSGIIPRFKTNKTQEQLDRAEELTRIKVQQAKVAFEKANVLFDNANREFEETLLPGVIKELKDISDVCQAGVRFELSKYSYVYKRDLLTNGQLIGDQDSGLRESLNKIDKAVDFRLHIKAFGGPMRYRKIADSSSYQRMPSRQSTSSLCRSEFGTEPASTRPIFGIDLTLQLERDQEEIPLILVKCASEIERKGLHHQGVYRHSGSFSQIQKLRVAFDTNARAVDLPNDASASEINNVVGVLKMWLRELPDPLFSRKLYNDFIKAARTPDDKRRVIQLHAKVNELPDANYAILKYLMSHLDRQ